MTGLPPVDDSSPGPPERTRGPRPGTVAAPPRPPASATPRALAGGPATAEAALEFFRQRLGLGETPPGSNCNEITSLFGVGCVPWCAETVSLALNVAWGDAERWQVPGVPSTYAIGTAYVPSLRQFFADAGMYHDSPEVGDVVIFTWQPGLPIGDHTGLVEVVVGDGTIVSLEGNTSDILDRKRRSMAVIDGFGRPPYDTPAPPTDKEQLPMEFTYIAEGEDFVYLGTESFHGRLPFGATLDGLKGAKLLVDLGQRPPEFHAGVKALSDQLHFAGDRKPALPK